MPYSDNDGPPSFLFLLAIAIGCLVWCICVSVSCVRFATGSTWTKGRITDCYTVGVPGRNLRPQETCHYEFQVGQERYSGLTHNGYLQEGQVVDLAYLMSDPANNTLEPPQWFPYGLVSLIAFLVSTGLSIKLFMSNDDFTHD